MAMSDCRYFDMCAAPLCPKDEAAAVGAWFPDESICRCADVPAWVKRQRKIGRKAAAGFCFTVAMLAHDCRITKNMKGVDPDPSGGEFEAAAKTWLVSHPLITAQERERKRTIGFKKKAVLCGDCGPKNGKQAGDFEKAL